MTAPFIGPGKIERLARIAGMLGSCHDGEVASAARQLLRGMRAEGFELADAIRLIGELQTVIAKLEVTIEPAPVQQSSWRKATAVRTAPMRRPAHQGHVDACLAALDLPAWETSFLCDIRNLTILSAKQSALLAKLYARAVEAVVAA